MINRAFEEALARVPGLQENSHHLSKTIHKAVLQGGEPARSIADVLHGTWLGHPLHPVLTDVTIGSWALGALFDALAALRGDRFAQEMADRLTQVGTLSAIPTLLSGLADYSTVQRPAASAATLHALLNDVNFVLYLLSVRDRRNGRRRRGVLFSTLAFALTIVSAWIGGHLVYGHKVGVDHGEARQGPEAWTPVLDAADLEEATPKRVDANGSPVLLYRRDGSIYAIGAVCSHAGGPLEEGSFDGCTVQCPWHDSVFDLRDGRVRHGPATHPQPGYAARVRDGQIEVRIVAP